MGKILKTTSYNRGAFVERLGFHLEFTPDFRNLSLTYEPYNYEDDRVLFNFQLTTVLGLLGLGFYLGLDGSLPTLLLSTMFLLLPWGNTFVNLPIRNPRPIGERCIEDRVYGIGFFENNLVLRWGNTVWHLPLPWCYVYDGESVWGKDGWEKSDGGEPSMSNPVRLISKNHRLLLFRWLGIPVFRRGMSLVVDRNGNRHHINLDENYVVESLNVFLKEIKPQRRMC